MGILETRSWTGGQGATGFWTKPEIQAGHVQRGNRSDCTMLPDHPAHVCSTLDETAFIDYSSYTYSDRFDTEKNMVG